MAEKESSEDSLVRKFTEGMTAAIAASQPKKVTFGEYIRRMPKFPKLKRRVMQNGYNGGNFTLPETILLNKLTHSGIYMDGKVEVEIKSSHGDETINFIYPNKTGDMRFDMIRYFGPKGPQDTGFEDLLRRLVEVQEAEDREAALMASPRR